MNPSRRPPPADIDPREIASTRRLIRQWFARHGRDLPWRRTRDPYAVLVSEIMLQQTQVATVIDYYRRWMEVFPTAISLADAPEQEVLARWQGLGYYARARNLHRAAMKIRDEFSGVFPATAEEIRKLPGVGRYTAGAVATFAFEHPEPIVDANIARVLSRWFRLSDPVDQAQGSAAVWEIASCLVPRRGALLFNSGLMELGATLCSPRNPQCLLCPIRRHCRAAMAGDAESFPVTRPRPKTIAREEDRALIVRRGKILLQQEPGPRWHGLWRLPDADPESSSPPLHVLTYPITRYRVTMRVHQGTPPGCPAENQRWYSVAELDALPMPSPHRRALQASRVRPVRG